MKNACILLFCALLGAFQSGYGQKAWTEYKYSVSAGFGSQKFTSRFDLNLGYPAFGKTDGSHHIYLDLGISGKKFPNTPNFNFNHINYSSNTSMVFFGFGYGFQYDVRRWNFQANAGFRYAYVRFRDGALVKAIGASGIQRWVDNYTVAVGPVVENGYGNAFSIDIAGRVGFRLIDQLEIYGNGALNPMRFNTSTTLFGKYWGEYPHQNSYWVRLFPLRFDVGMRFLFGE